MQIIDRALSLRWKHYMLLWLGTIPFAGMGWIVVEFTFQDGVIEHLWPYFIKGGALYLNWFLFSLAFLVFGVWVISSRASRYPLVFALAAPTVLALTTNYTLPTFKQHLLRGSEAYWFILFIGICMCIAVLCYHCKSFIKNLR